MVCFYYYQIRSWKTEFAFSVTNLYENKSFYREFFSVFRYYCVYKSCLVLNYRTIFLAKNLAQSDPNSVDFSGMKADQAAERPLGMTAFTTPVITTCRTIRGKSSMIRGSTTTAGIFSRRSPRDLSCTLPVCVRRFARFLLFARACVRVYYVLRGVYVAHRVLVFDPPDRYGR